MTAHCILALTRLPASHGITFLPRQHERLHVRDNCDLCHHHHRPHALLLCRLLHASAYRCCCRREQRSWGGGTAADRWLRAGEDQSWRFVWRAWRATGAPVWVFFICQCWLLCGVPRWDGGRRARKDAPDVPPCVPHRCIDAWLRRNPTCPICRMAVRMSEDTVVGGSSLTERVPNVWANFPG